MLDTATKKRIDDCRDILVGKLPDPKAQIEQITIGLIYKFMDDMDKEAIELGGTAKFFSGNFEKYSWDSLFDTKVTAIEMLGLYSEAIVSMDKNPNIPQLFRDIFKNAYLPYRDPETLKLFLKTIGEFEYTHSEKLGDAFEYLLSVMGSQGDAGQFRTPRHIIDFLVAVVNPRKTDTILDPACGTAGFLISAFKYIMNGGNDGNDGNGGRDKACLVSTPNKPDKPYKPNKPDTPDERKRIISNFVGYDISPDMVRLSLVNLYLHGFSDPHISEYDTLSSEERWADNFDVILANPPFMSPKGGIRPHKRFTVSSNRSEVLFVDYIAEHLNPKGRAGVIVPEGVIFQSGTAYKELRKMLVDNFLYAVVSLPAGIFNPYAGVKTSILLMDKEIAKRSNEILFVKIDNDGYNLGAQRNAVKGGQLEEAIAVIRSFTQPFQAENNANDVADDAGNNTANNDTAAAGYAVDGDDVGGDAVGGGAVGGDTVGSDAVNAGDVRNTDDGTAVGGGAVDGGAVDGNAVDGTAVDGTAVETRHALSLQQQQHHHHQQQHTQSIAHAVPKTEIAKNGDYNLSGERYVVNKRSIDASFKLFELGDITTLTTGGTPRSSVKEYYENGDIKWLVSGDIHQGQIFDCEGRITELGMKDSNARFLPENSVMIALNGQGKTRGTVAILRTKATCNQSLVAISPIDRIKLLSEYLYEVLRSMYQDIRNLTGHDQRSGLNMPLIRKIQIPLPPLSIQQEIVAEIEGYQKIIDGAKMVVENYKPKITIDPEWDMVELQSISTKLGDGLHGTPTYSQDGEYFFVNGNNLLDNKVVIKPETKKITKEEYLKYKKELTERTIFVSINGTLGNVALYNGEKIVLGKSICYINLKNSVDKDYVKNFLQSTNFTEYTQRIATGSTIQNVSLQSMRAFNLPIPPLETQHLIVAQIEKEQELVNANKQLVEIFEQKIKDRIAKVWGV